MKQIKILGPGCRRCEQLAAATKEAADQLGIDYELEKLTDVIKFADYGVMMTPGLVVDGEVKSQGKVLSVNELKAMLA
jgi:small redox-active disulfide protein 2